MYQSMTEEELAQPRRIDNYLPEGIDKEKTHEQARASTLRENLIVVVHDHAYKSPCKDATHYLYKDGERLHEWPMK